jgi:nucleotide-binding universal stress UspA family protein
MAPRASFHVVVGTDGSPHAQAAVKIAASFPWPGGARLHAVVARGDWAGGPAGAEWYGQAWRALERTAHAIGQRARRVLVRRGSDAEMTVTDAPPTEALLSQARRLRARMIVVGSRGYGRLGRLLLGSVSRGVVRRADCPVLVVKGRPRRVRRFTIGLDGSANSRRAVALVETLPCPPGGRVTLVSVVEPMALPSLRLLPASVRTAVSGQASRLTRRRRRAAQREARAAARGLRRAGWTIRSIVRVGVPLRELLDTATAARADVLVLGARGVGGVERLLLGSVAEGALTRSPVPVLIVK